MREEHHQAHCLFRPTGPHSCVTPALLSQKAVRPWERPFCLLGWIRAPSSKLLHFHPTEGCGTLSLKPQAWSQEPLSAQAYSSPRPLRANKQILCLELTLSQFSLRDPWTICSAALARIFLL